jgi:hypothetical protein
MSCNRIAVLWVGLVLGFPVAGLFGAPPARAPDAADSAKVAPTRRLLEQRIDLDVKNAGVDAALKSVSEAVPGLSIVLDPDLATGGYDLSKRLVSLKVKQLPAGTIVALLCQQGDLGHKVGPGHVLVLPREKMFQQLPVATYRVAALLVAAGRPPAGGGPPVFDDLRNVVQRVVNNMSNAAVAAWSDKGGPASIEYQNGLLIVSQTPEGHERISDLLRQLAAVMAGRPATPSPRADEAKATAQTQARLQRIVDLDLERVSLAELLPRLGDEQPDLNIVIDQDIAAGGIDLSVRVMDLKIKQVSVESLLSLVLGGDLGYEARPGYVLVSTKAKLLRRLTMAVHPVADLAAARGAAGPTAQQMTDLAALIMRTVNSEGPATSSRSMAAWNDEGGPAAICTFGGALIVTQTAAGHKQIADFLMQLRHRGKR